MITGMITGDSDSRKMARRPGREPRTRPKAPQPPMQTAIAAAVSASSMLNHSEACQSRAAKNFAYHCQEKPGGGKTRNSDELNDRMKTMISGADMKIIAARP